ncbi:MAG: hypothetical protein H6Q19_1914 [Bacteroidetes bacterium]|nr:hypothetical protein [Bacteroidota bacterium]
MQLFLKVILKNLHSFPFKPESCIFLINSQYYQIIK